MPHTFTNRPRKFANFFVDPEQLGLQFRYERVNAWCYELGGVLFVIASVLTLPSLEKYKALSSNMIIAASSCFLVVSLHDCVEFITLGKDIRRSDFIAVALYILGSSALIHGSIYFHPNNVSERVGYVSFAVGSISFIIGSVLNSLHIFESPTRRTAQYFLLTAISFVIGSTMFLVGSTAHFTLDFRDPGDLYTVNTFISVFYIFGSLMFCLGGVFNALRFSIVMRRDVREQEKKNPFKRLLRLFADGSSGTTSYGAMNGNGTTSGDKTDEGGDTETNYERDCEEDLYMSGSSSPKAC